MKSFFDRHEKKILTVMVVISIIGFLHLVYNTGFTKGQENQRAFDKCVEELGCDCTPEVMKEQYLPVEKQVWFQIYPFCVELEMVP